ncbi:MAG: glycosyltransferase [Acidimicrobiia bacterium]|nr:glycosyltransferase [Acidimicrobiia bacterium]
MARPVLADAGGRRRQRRLDRPRRARSRTPGPGPGLTAADAVNRLRGWLGRFALVGVAATVLDVGLLWVLGRAGVNLLVANLCAVALAAVLSYTLHRLVTFQNDPFVRWVEQPSAFLGVATLAAGVDLMVLGLGLSVGVPLLLAKVLAVLAAAVVRVVAYRWLLFQGIRSSQGLRVDRPQPPGELRLSVVIPAYREEREIDRTLEQVRRALHDVAADGGIEIVVVDDGSPDDTAGAARRGGADQVVVQPENRGKGAAVRAGVLVARGRTVAFTDADLAYAPDQLLALLARVEEGWDVVVGSRHHRGATTLVQATRLREVGSRLINLFTMALLLGQYRDTQCGLKAFRSDIGRVLFGQTRVDGFAFDIELFHLAERYELSLVEVPVRVENSERSTVKVVRDALRLVRDLFRIRRWAKQGAYAELPTPEVVPADGHEQQGKGTSPIPQAQDEARARPEGHGEDQPLPRPGGPAGPGRGRSSTSPPRQARR